MEFFFEVLIDGLLAGVMYSLVAIGFVLIYKASGVFNFAQGAMVLFAALTFVSLVERSVPFFWAFLATLASMIVLALLIERLVLRPLVNRPPIILFMATLGLSYVIEGLAQACGARRCTVWNWAFPTSRWKFAACCSRSSTCLQRARRRRW